jgi:hypothetical protein
MLEGVDEIINFPTLWPTGLCFPQFTQYATYDPALHVSHGIAVSGVSTDSQHSSQQQALWHFNFRGALVALTVPVKRHVFNEEPGNGREWHFPPISTALVREADFILWQKASTVRQR